MFFNYLRAIVVLLSIFLSSSVSAGWSLFAYGNSEEAANNQYSACTGYATSCSIQGSGSNWTIFYWEPIEEPSCPEGQTQVGTSQECEGSPCPDGMSPIDDGQGNVVCLPDAGDPPEECQDVAGYITDANGGVYQVCNDAKNDCEEAGGQLGQFNGETVCVPEGSGPPECSSTGGLVMVEEGYVCESPTDNPNGTDNLDEGNNAGADPDTDTDIENPESEAANDPDPDTITDATELNQESLRESQEANKSLRKMQNQLGDINDELDAQSGFMDRAEEREEGRDQSRAMPEHTVNNSATFSEASNSFMTGLYSTPIVQSFSAVSNVIPSGGGSCPVLSIDLTATPIGQTVSTDIHCTLFLGIASELAAICLVVYSIMGFRIVVSS